MRKAYPTIFLSWSRRASLIFAYGLVSRTVT